MSDKSNKSPAFQFYVKDWLSSARISLMTPEQEGAYIRLLAYDWDLDGIPDNDEILASLSRLGQGWFKGGSTVVKPCFIQHPSKKGYLTNERLIEERKKQAEWRAKSAAGGRKSAEMRDLRCVKGGSRVVQPNGNTASSSSSSSSNLNNIERESGKYPKSVEELRRRLSGSLSVFTEAELSEYFILRDGRDWMIKQGVYVGNIASDFANWKKNAARYSKPEQQKMTAEERLQRAKEANKAYENQNN